MVWDRVAVGKEPETDEHELEAQVFITGGKIAHFEFVLLLMMMMVICCSGRDQTEHLCVAGKNFMYCTIPLDLGFIESGSPSVALAVLELIFHLSPI